METKEFIEYMEAKDLSKATQRGHVRRTYLFLVWYQLDPINCTQKDIINYLEYLQNDKKFNNTYRATFLKSIEHYFQFLITTGNISNNPTVHIKLRGTNKKRMYYVYEPEQMEELYDHFYKYYITHFDESHIHKGGHLVSRLSRHRYYIMLGFLMFQGIATHELQELELEDVDTNKAILHLRGTNKTEPRKIHLKAFQIGAIMNYLNTIRHQFFEFCEPSNKFFLPLNLLHCGKKSNTKRLLQIVRKLNEMIPILDKNFHKLHQFRTSMITYWLRTDGLRKAQYLAGHKYIRATEMYVTNDIQSLIDDIAKHHPVT